jgi:hypothetical protein
MTRLDDKLEEFLARALAARKMRPAKDPHGARLPDNLWRQCLPEAEFITSTILAFQLRQEVLRFYMSDEEGE